MSKPEVKQLDIPCMKLGEGPHWLQPHAALLFVDVFSKAIRKYYPDTKRNQILYIDDGGEADTVTFAIPVKNNVNKIVYSIGKHIAIVEWLPSDPDIRTVKVSNIVHTTKDDHFNDAKCDPRGRLWAGTMTPLDKDGEILEFNTSSLFTFDKNFNCKKFVDKTTISNGLAWSHDRKLMYFIDSPSKNIYCFDYDDEAGSIRNQRVLLNFDTAGLKDQAPDGMAIDTAGNLWIACFGGGQVICVEPKSGKIVNSVKIPSPHVTSVCWGGPQYEVLYVTSGTLKLAPDLLASLALSAGGTFAVYNLGKGLEGDQCVCE